jgi:hypothetical protein
VPELFLKIQYAAAVSPVRVVYYFSHGFFPSIALRSLCSLKAFRRAVTAGCGGAIGGEKAFMPLF